ncbi:membrane protein insertion efficiency factor YidD [Timonella sp. A28]|uniref:membrane protein insertion efficiency factor YidD n=1 Tax=Timonella sp. A28 TaxID=3442640 RepID=UPI003EBDF749
MRALLRLPKKALIGFVRLYQKYISPLSGPRCRFYPSCSSYAVQSIEIHGAFKGTGLAIWRLLRCNPWNPGGIDDVPPKKTKPTTIR